MDSKDSPPPSRPALPGFALALGILWLAAGALYKLFDGHPADLPSSVIEKSPFDAWNTFRFAIAAELAVVALVITVPQLGWLALSGVFATFITVLFPLVAEGAESCGCFGGTITIKPIVMMAIDGGLLGLILFSRPWRLPSTAGLGLLAALPLVIAGVAGPIVKLPRPAAVETIGAPTERPATAVSSSATSPSGPGADQSADPDALDPAPEVAVRTEPEPVAAEPVAPALPIFMELPFMEMQDTSLYDQPFYAIADQSEGFMDAFSHVVVYRQTCEVCEEHLKTLAAEEARGEPSWGDKILVLLRIEEEIDTPGNNLCTVLPEAHQKVKLPALERGYLVTTPVSFDIDDQSRIRSVVDIRKELGH
ncbi:MAG: hypothetical protein VX015_02655 [Planctomycetota bacterium]|nr:hypothetical protein [Planctomycetota bacterium]